MQNITAIIQPPTFQALLCSDIPSDLNHLILPHVICWHPLIQFPLLTDSLEACPVDKCKGKLQFHEWACGQSKGKQPRLLHDIQHTVLLAGAIYKCTEGQHTIYSTDPLILQKIGVAHLPFFLLHRSGFTRIFVHCVVSLAHEGLNIKAIARHIQSLREEYASELILKLMKECRCIGKELTQSEIDSLTASTSVSSIAQPFPSNDIIARCFIIHFQQNEDIYTAHMMNLSITKSIRLDHTFKVASNIGYLRPDGRWVTQYGSVLMVLNEEGEVVTWQFTNSTSIDEVQPLLCSLKERIKVSEGTHLTIYVDNCCHVRSKLKSIFGNDTIVKLDIFHAIQRITRVMSKKHLLFFTCMNDFKMIFRKPSDIGQKRTMSTPTSEQILVNIENFVTKWKNAEHNGHKILNEKVMEQIYSLQVHIRHGCLSDIEPGGGTNYNEALHRYINPHFSHAGRIGLPLAYAILTILLYKHNCKKLPKASKSLSATLATKCKPAQMVSGSFGIVGRDGYGPRDQWMRIKIDDLITKGDDSESLLYFTGDGDDCFTISITDIHRIVKNAQYSTDVAKHMQQISDHSQTFSYRMMPFMSGVPSMYFHSLDNNTNQSCMTHEKRLTGVLDAWNMCKHEIEGDGNCCFTAVAFGLITNSTNLTYENKQFLLSCGIDPSMDVQAIATQLRHLAVAEWTENYCYYQDFVPGVDIQQEASKFLSSGFYYGDLADTMILALSNALQTTIIVFSSIECHPVFCISPRMQTIAMPIMVAFTQYGSGHYDGVLSKSKGDQTPKMHLTCSCGKNDKEDKLHCQEIKCKYTTVIRCHCLKNKRACSEYCRCKNCGNKLGKRVVHETHQRKRRKHEWQMFRQLSSIEFADVKLEQLSAGPLTIMEFFVLENVLVYCEEEAIEPTPENISKLYGHILATTTLSSPTLPLSHKNERDISTFLAMHQKNLANFQWLCRNQLDWNTNNEL